MKMAGEFANYLGILECEVGGRKLRLKPNLRDKQALMALMTKTQKSDLTEEEVAKQHGIFMDILTRSYPEDKEQDLMNFLLVNDLQFMMALFVGFGWADKEKVEELKKNPKKVEELIQN